ncbi:hypothetical protein GYMLUDRAFT_253096 [Collybiopsis luxurians FD-317 M1]|uniref:F-box domain-containing protein n=1 Tax=Collybiopsis luxurians FD-317 M1 TaxID=944289 RepID=A0A0D0BXY4_9AGAR|nr:hypothetical protein GYMLUDRAFT_253096 [Collybiopsis luxurians FD-317 M1]
MFAYVIILAESLCYRAEPSSATAFDSVPFSGYNAVRFRTCIFHAKRKLFLPFLVCVSSVLPGLVSVEVRSRAIYSRIFRYLNVPQVIRFSRLNRQVHELVEAFDTQAFDAKRHIRLFFSGTEYEELRELQHTTGAILSGEPVDRFFHRLSADGELTIITKVGTHEAIRSFLSRIRYADCDEVQAEPNYENFVIATAKWKYVREGITVHLIAAAETPMEVILNCDTTLFMNFWNNVAAYSLYPENSSKDYVGFRNLARKRSEIVDSVRRICLHDVVNMPKASAILREKFTVLRRILPLCRRQQMLYSPSNKLQQKPSSFAPGHCVFLGQQHRTYFHLRIVFVVFRFNFGENLHLTTYTSLGADFMVPQVASFRNSDSDLIRRDVGAWTLTSSLFQTTSDITCAFSAHTANVLMQLCKALLLRYQVVKLVQHEVDQSLPYIRAVIEVTPRNGDTITTYEYNDILNFLLKKDINIRFTWPQQSSSKRAHRR